MKWNYAVIILMGALVGFCLFVFLLPVHAAELNTTELDAAMETCRKHIVPYQGEYVFDKGWGECNAINAEWRAMRGGSPSDPTEDKAKIHQYLMKRLQ